ncbi:MAG: RHS repeat-associated core domain protein [Parcubacteria group bacterium Gr01-1014_33]|nr:MAG: RHS repeat-associated core domain protein [Parcubacteria group bacterium Gr01-1014_33]
MRKLFFCRTILLNLALVVIVGNSLYAAELTPAPAAMGTIQGFKVKGVGDTISSPPASETVTLDGGNPVTANPYFHRNVSAGNHTVSVTVPSGWTVGYTLCYNSTACHNNTPVKGSIVVVNVPANGYADLWWHYTPPTPTGTISASPNTSTILAGLKNLYSPSVITFQGVKKMWLGGWLTDADVGPDKIYYSELLGDTWTRPQEVFKKDGFHVNDPSIIQPPSSDGVNRANWLYMYYTALDNTSAASATEMVKRNVVGLASSVDGGKTWTDHGIVINEANGIDSTGAWSPSAIVVGNEIWVYFHTNESAPRILRTRFNLNGFQRISTAQVTMPFSPSCSPYCISNVDVSREGSHYVMFANTADLKNIVRFVSTDGITWTIDSQTTSGYLLRDNSAMLLTPHKENINGASYKVYYGYDTGAGSQSIRIGEYEIQNSPVSPASAPPKFTTNDRIKTTATLNVRSSGAIAAEKLGTQLLGSKGTVKLGPVSADGYAWWYVDYDTGVDGWSAGEYMEKGSAITPTPTPTAPPVTTPPTGSISASPNPCTISTGATTCTSNITWSTTNAPNAEVTVSNPDGTEKQVFAATAPSRSNVAAPWIKSSGALFKLKSQPGGTVLDQILVTGMSGGQTPPSPSAPEADVTADKTAVPQAAIVMVKWCGGDGHPCAGATTCTLKQNGTAIKYGTSGTWQAAPIAKTDFDLVCTNAAGVTATDRVTINVSGFLTSPVVNAGSAHTLTLDAPHIHTGATATDADGDLSTYRWVIACPNDIYPCAGNITNQSGTLAGSSATIPLMYTPLINGPYNLQLIVTDASGRTSIRYVTDATLAPAPPPPVLPVVTLTVTPSSALQGQANAFAVTWNVTGGTATAANDWIGMFKAGSVNQNYEDEYHYTNGQTAGTVSFTAPTLAGDYEFRYLPRDGYVDVARSNRVSVASTPSPPPPPAPAPAPPPPLPPPPPLTTLSVTPASLVQGQGSFTVTWNAAGVTRSPYDWIGMFKVGDANQNYGQWFYTDGQASGTKSFSSAVTPGEYKFRYLLDDGYTDVGQSSKVTVTAGTALLPASSLVRVAVRPSRREAKRYAALLSTLQDVLKQLENLVSEKREFRNSQ